MKKGKFLLGISVFLFGITITNAKVYTLQDGDGTCKENCIDPYDYIIGTHLYKVDFLGEHDGQLPTNYVMYGSTSFNASSVKDVSWYLYTGSDTLLDVANNTSIPVPESRTFEITCVNGVCDEGATEFNITYNYIDNDASTKNIVKQVAYGKKAENIVPPVRFGYKFDGWVLKSEEEEKPLFDFETLIDKAYELEAKYSPIDYTITFKDTITKKPDTITKPGEGEEPIVCNFSTGNKVNCTYKKYEEAIGELPLGYNFVGWSLAPTGEKVYSDSTQESFKEIFTDKTDITLYAIFGSSDSYKISYNLDGGTFAGLESPVTVYDPAVLKHQVSKPVKIGYDFVKWEVSGDATIEDTTLTINVPGNISLTALWEPIKYDVVYDGVKLNGESPCKYDAVCNLDLSSIDTKAKKDGKAVGKITANINDQVYTIGDKVLNLINSKVTPDDLGVSQITLDVEFVDVKNIISYDYDGGTASNQTAAINNTTVTLTPPTKKGYTFTKWEVTSGNASVHDDTLTLGVVEGDIFVKAHWKANTYNVMYNDTKLNTDACTYDQKCVLDFAKIKAPAGQMLDKVTANGEEITNAVYNLATEGSATVKATFKDIKYLVNYNLDGGVLKEANATSITKDGSIKLNAPTKYGYHFNGWKVKQEYATVSKGNELKFSKDTYSDLDLTATWKALEYNVKYEGQNLNNETCVFGKVCSLDLGKIKAPKGEYLTSLTVTVDRDTLNISDKVYNLVTTDTNDGKAVDLTAKALFGNEDFAVVYDYQGGSLEGTNKGTLNKGETIDLIRPTKKGYEFKKWTVSKNAKVEGDKLSFNKDYGIVSVKAEWTPITYTVRSSGSSNVTCTYDKACSIKSLKPVLKQGHTFSHFAYDGKKLGDEVLNLADTNKEVEIETVSSTKYPITYNYQEGYVINDNPIYYDNASLNGDIELNVPKRAGYTFDGWEDIRVDSNLPVASIEGNTLHINGQYGKITITAKWKQKIYTINYTEVESPIEASTGTFTTLVVHREPPEKKGFKFVGWEDTENHFIYKAGEQVELYEDTPMTLTFKPIWEANAVHEIKYNLAGGTFAGAPIVTFSEGIGSNLSVPTKAGYSFVGWFKSDGVSQVESIGTDVKEDVELVAHWKENTYTISYRVPGFSPESDVVTYEYDKEASLMEYPIVTNEAGGHIIGWSTTSDGPLYYGNAISFKNLALEGNIDLYPVFDKNA